MRIARSGGSTTIDGVVTGPSDSVAFAPEPTFDGPVIINGPTNDTVLASSGQTLTGSNASSAIDISVVWNTSANVILDKMNVGTNTQSGSNSLLWDRQIAGVSQGKLAKTGDFTVTGFIATAAAQFFSIIGRCRLYGLSTTGGGLDVRTSGGGAQAPALVSILQLTDGVDEPNTIAGVAQLYVDVADGDLKVKFGDGFVRTLGADS